MNKLVYKILDTKTGLYDNGGSGPEWTKSGKTWTSIGHVKTHLREVYKHLYILKYHQHLQNTDDYIFNLLDNWKIIEIERKEDIINTIDIKNINKI